MKKKMNKKGEEGVSNTLWFLMGLIIFVMIAGLMIYFIGNIYDLFKERPDQASVGSYEYLVSEIEDMQDGETRTVPYYIRKSAKGDQYYLVTGSGCPVEKKDDKSYRALCLCKSAYCTDGNLIKSKIFDEYDIEIDTTNKGKYFKVKNPSPDHTLLTFNVLDRDSNPIDDKELENTGIENLKGQLGNLEIDKGTSEGSIKQIIIKVS